MARGGGGDFGGVVTTSFCGCTWKEKGGFVEREALFPANIPLSVLFLVPMIVDGVVVVWSYS